MSFLQLSSFCYILLSQVEIGFAAHFIIPDLHEKFHDIMLNVCFNQTHTGKTSIVLVHGGCIVSPKCTLMKEVILT